MAIGAYSNQSMLQLPPQPRPTPARWRNLDEVKDVEW